MTLNKITTRKELVRIKRLSIQDTDGQFDNGCNEQQHAAQLVENVLHNLKLLLAKSSLIEIQEIAAATLLALKDIQIRDYALGLLTTENQEKAALLFRWLTKLAPVAYIAAPTTLLALIYYEKYQDGRANELLAPALAQDYSLAKLLNRVFQSDWPIGEFNKMRIQIHPKVTATIFGGTDE